jgi:chromosome partitioning protein
MLVAVLNSKGGVGKSTIAVHAAVWLHERGIRLAVIDADAQASTSEWLSQAAPAIRIERCDSLAALQKRVPRLTAVYQAVVADGPAALSAETVALAAAADLVLMPIGPSMMDIRASYRTARLLYSIRLRLNHGERPRVVTVLNRVQRRTRLAQLALVAVQKYGFPVAAQYLNQRLAYAEACGLGSVAWRMGPHARHAGEEVRRLLDETLGPYLPDLKINPTVAEPPQDLPVPRTLLAGAVLAAKTPLPGAEALRAESRGTLQNPEMSRQTQAAPWAGASDPASRVD